MTEDRTFELGVVMAGAISAGAYTAGVMDFLFEALDAYEEAKGKPSWNGPTHNVRIPVNAGASAGGMTSAISALHAFRDLDHVWPGKLPPAPSAIGFIPAGSRIFRSGRCSKRPISKRTRRRRRHVNAVLRCSRSDRRLRLSTSTGQCGGATG